MITEALAFTGLAGWGFWSAAAVLPKGTACTWCICIGAVLLNGSLIGCMATEIWK